MSTSYYRLRPPVTHLKLKDTGGHNRLSVWVDHQLVGALMLSKESTRAVVWAFVAPESDSACPLRTHWGGSERGSVVTINDPTLPDEAVVLSEYGELLTVAEVKARDGAKREDGMPTELFGYEEAES